MQLFVADQGVDRPTQVRIGCAGWAIPKKNAALFPAEGSHLERYAARFACVEINSSFYRPHRRATYERWAASVPESFRFAVKLPKEVTHARRLVGGEGVLERFLSEIRGLGHKLGPILVQLPPSLAFDPTIARLFFAGLRARFGGQIACEPRHASWFTDEVEATWATFSIARVAADPVLAPGADLPAGWPGFVYVRLHGSPRTYYSAYEPRVLQAWAGKIHEASASSSAAWCILDNTALGAASADAVSIAAMFSERAVSTEDGSELDRRRADAQRTMTGAEFVRRSSPPG